MKRYALDSNIVSYVLKKNIRVTGRLRDEIDNGNSVIIPPTVYMENKEQVKSKKEQIRRKK
jgi:rRNA-processing protein FCF1